ncbi:M13-type metalloendopeptidase [Coralloluteibacterium stylophorae]|uniref:M13 family metallopeptidase n=1 Tax=Coralloluteibacterium stylophorae TaxID=1776034 RepID=A0A8J7VUG0_9GAMM|nr:M13 family metallopeptidase [Coralloluteibacterium stylophorae]MBS7456205.1 M13 family metallopeptidase [Coralloluteibacterium stylophorae]
MPRRHPLALAVLLGATALSSASAALAQAAQAPAAPAACVDFYGHVNQAWLAANPLPPGAEAFGQLDQLNARALEQQREILNSAMTAPQTPRQRLLGDFWASGLDTAAIEAAGAAAIQPLLAKVDAVKRPGDLGEVVGELHAAGVPVLFNFAADIDLKDFSRTVGYASQGGLGLPDPDYYTRTDADAQALLGRYRAYVEAILAAMGTREAELGAKSGTILQVEILLARASTRLDDLRDPRAAYNMVGVRELRKSYPNLGFKDFLDAQDVSADSISVAQPGFFEQLDALLASVPLEQWQLYLRYQVASSMAPYMGDAFLSPYLELYGHVLRGAERAPPREVLLMDYVINPTLGELVGEEYVERFLSPAAREAGDRIGAGLKTALGESIDAANWLGDDAKAEARAKLEALDIEIGAPQQRRIDFSALQFDRARFAANVLAVAAERHRQEMARIGKDDAAERRWPTLPQVPDVSYILDENRLVVTAAMMQPPVFDAAGDAASNYGALGALMGNQMAHAFDAVGNYVDSRHQLRQWWSEADRTAWDQRTKALVAQYDAFSPEAGLRVRGAQTREENAADLAGLEIALDAWRAAEPQADAAATQRFFEGWARLWAQHITPGELKLRLATDVHAPAQYRVNGPLANLPAFGEAFQCSAGQPMVTAEPAGIWH